MSARRPFRYFSTFSGIDAASVAWRPLGWVPAAFSEIEPFPCSVLKAHYPEVPNLGDITRITDEVLGAIATEGVDLLVGGAPC